jgi:hypothetical protein
MYKVNNTLTSAYGDMDMANMQGPDMPHYTVSNRRITNVPVGGGGEYIQGIRKNTDLGIEDFTKGAPASADYDMAPVRPLRYTPGLKCDAHLESLRPSRDPKNQPIQGGDQWKKKLIQAPQTYDGSFADADMQKFRPNPNPNPMEDPWYSSRLPEPTMCPVDRLAMPMNYGGVPYGPEAGPYNSWYPQDELSAIKMRNRRYQNAVMGEMMSLNGNLPMGYYPYPQQGMMMRPPMNAPMGPAPPPPQMFDYEQAHDELAIMDQELNVTRRTTKPFIPTNAPNYWGLQRQVQAMEEPIPQVKAPREITSIDQLPAPKRLVKAPLTEAAMPKSNRPEVRIADQIAIRSFVLGSKLGRIGSGKTAGATE